MVRECKVILRNSANMVVLFGDIEVQMPSDNRRDGIVYVNFENEKYSLISKDDYANELYRGKKAKLRQSVEENKN